MPKDILEERGAIYGSAEINLTCAAHLINNYMAGRDHSDNGDGVSITAHDVAIIMILVKVARIATGKYHSDNYHDILGYARIAEELGKP